MFKNLFAAVGLFFMVLLAAGALGIGNFYWYYGPAQIKCFNSRSSK